MWRFECPYLQDFVELSEERANHIVTKHPELAGDFVDRLGVVLSDPDEIRTDGRFPLSRLFARWFDDILGGKILVVAVVTDNAEASTDCRHWVVTAYPTRRLPGKGVVEWSRR
jgi:hypothetical protein